MAAAKSQHSSLAAKLGISGKPKVGSLDNVHHKPKQSTVTVKTYPVRVKGKPKVGSLDNVGHQVGGGDKQIYDEKLHWEAQPKITANNITYRRGGGNKKIEEFELSWNAKPKVGSLENAKHVPGGGEKTIYNDPRKPQGTPRIDSLSNARHIPGGGQVSIHDQKMSWEARRKIDAKNDKYKRGGGTKQIRTLIPMFERMNTLEGGGSFPKRYSSTSNSTASSQTM